MTRPIPASVAGLCDDAAIFPPGLAPLPAAVLAHQLHTGRWYAGLVGPLVLAVAALPRLGPLLPPPPSHPLPGSPLTLSMTLPAGPDALGKVFVDCAQLPVRLASVEIAVPDRMQATEFFDRLAEGIGVVDEANTVDIYVEVPRDDRRATVISGLGTRYRAKFRTGGVRADLYPDETELADAVAAVVDAGIPFKATAGLHHALRNTDPETGFEQHGFLNLLLAAEALSAGGSETDARTLLAERDGFVVSNKVRCLDDEQIRRARAAFTSFGTCTIAEPLAELIELDVVTVPPEGRPVP